MRQYPAIDDEPIPSFQALSIIKILACKASARGRDMRF